MLDISYRLEALAFYIPKSYKLITYKYLKINKILYIMKYSIHISSHIKKEK